MVLVLLLSVSGNTLLGEASIKANAESLSTYDVMVMEDIEENISTGSEWFDTVSALRQQIVEYQTMRKQTKDEETKDKLDNLIASTQRLVDCCVEQSLDAANEGIVSYADVGETIGYETIIATAIGLFSSMGCKLSAELLTLAADNRYSELIYSPIYGGRAISSPLLQKIMADESATSGIFTFPFAASNRNELDLSLSIHGVEYLKSGSPSKIISLSDRYDFEEWQLKDFWGNFETDLDTTLENLKEFFIGLPNNFFAEIQEKGFVVPYDVLITIDMREPLGIDIVGETGAIGGAGTWEVDITNNGDEAIELIYNEKMCFEDNARIWSSLTDIVIPSTKIPGGGTKRVTIQKNAAATHMAFSYIKGSTRYVTFADEIGLNKSISTELTTNYVYKYGQVEIRGKHGTTWMLRIFNNFGYTRTVEYNAKMCFESDAKNWENLNDVKRFSLAAGTYRDISIEENYFADYIALRFLGGQIGMQIYAKDLDPKGTMSLVRGNFVIYTYLTISNAGKSGSSWKINIKNPFSESITVYYNARMCFDDDAKKWTGLNDVKSVTIGANQTKQVNISENFFATTVAFSYINSGERLITYANSLTTSGGIKVMNSVV